MGSGLAWQSVTPHYSIRWKRYLTIIVSYEFQLKQTNNNMVLYDKSGWKSIKEIIKNNQDMIGEFSLLNCLEKQVVYTPPIIKRVNIVT